MNKLCENCNAACCRGYTIPIRDVDDISDWLTKWDDSRVHRVMIMIDDTCIALKNNRCQNWKNYKYKLYISPIQA